jgi:hypothetical protein
MTASFLPENFPRNRFEVINNPCTIYFFRRLRLHLPIEVVKVSIITLCPSLLPPSPSSSSSPSVSHRDNLPLVWLVLVRAAFRRAGTPSCSLAEAI